jgi:hypothetical protein
MNRKFVGTGLALTLAVAFVALLGIHTDAVAQTTIDLTVENVDPSGQWLYSEGTVQVQGIVTSEGQQSSPHTMSIPLPNGIRVWGIYGSTLTSKYDTGPTDWFYVNDRDLITVNAVTLELTTTPNNRPAGTALIQIVYPVVEITVVSVDRAGALVPGEVQVQGGTTSDGLNSSPVTVTMVDSIGSGIRVRGKLGDRETAYTDYFVVTDRDFVEVSGGVATTTPGQQSSRKARVEVEMDVAVPVLASIGDLAVPEGQVVAVQVTATDDDGSIPDLTAQNLPPFAGFLDNNDGTGTLTMSPAFGVAGTYSDVLIVATDSVDPDLSTSETISITVTTATPITVTVENVDPTGQWLYSYGSVQVQGIVTTDGLKTSPQTVTFATGNDIRVKGRLGTGPTDFSFFETAISADFTVDDGDLFVIDALTMAVDERAGQAAAGTATVQIHYPVIEITAVTVDQAGNEIPGEVQLQDGVTTKGLKPSPATVTMVDGAGKVVDVRGVLGDRDLGTVNDVPVVGRDWVAIEDGVPGTTPDSEPVNKAKITVAFEVSVPVLAQVGNQTLPEGAIVALPISATDGDGTFPNLTALNLPPFAALVDNNDGTGVLTLSPSFEQAGVYPDVVIVATDEVDPALTDTETITITVTESAPLEVTVENLDPTAQWMYDYGTVQVQGDYTTDGPVASPETASFASGSSIRVLGQLGTGDEDTSFFLTAFSEYFTVDDRDLIVVDALTMAVNKQTEAVPAGTAKIQISYPVIKITVESVDAGDNQIPAVVQLQDGVTTKGPKATPYVVTMVDAPGKVLDVRGVLGDRDLGFVSDVNVTNRDLVTIAGGVPGTTPNAEPVNTARLGVKFAVNVPVLATVGNQTLPEGQIVALPITATDGDGTFANLTALNLPPFAALVDNNDGTGVLTLSPSFEQAGVYPDVVIVATDEVDPDLADTETITITVTESTALAVTVENHDPTSQWLYDSGVVRVQGAATTDGPKASPQTLYFASGGSIRVLGQLGTGDEDFSFYLTEFSEYFTVDDRDLIVVDALTMAVNKQTEAVPAGTAKIQISYPVIKITVESVDDGDNQIPAVVQLQDGVTTKGPKATPYVVTMVDAPGMVLDVRGVLGDRDLGFVNDVPVTNRDLVTITGGVAGTTPGVEPVNTARLGVKFSVNVPVLADVEDQTFPEGQTVVLPITATDGDGTFANLTAQNLPPFAALVDNNDGTGVLTLAPSFEQAGVYPDVVIVATDEVDPDLADTDTITITVIDAVPITVTVENHDPTGQWLYEYGDVQVQGAATSGGAAASPATIQFATGGEIRVLGQLGPGDEDSSFYDTVWSAFFAVNSGERIVVDALTMAITRHPDEATPGTALVQIAYPVILITVEAVDGDGNLIPGEIQLQGGVTTKGLRSSPLQATMVDGVGKLLDVRGLLGDRDLGFVTGIAVTNRDLVTIEGGVASIAPNTEPSNRARIRVGFAVDVPVLAEVGDQALDEGQMLEVAITAADGDGTNPNLVGLNLPPFATLTDNDDGTGVLSLRPNFEQAGTYPGVVIVATDEVDPDLVDTDTITIVVADAVPLPVTVQNVDPTGQWLYEEGTVQVQGAATTDGPRASPQTVLIATGNDIRVLGQLGTGDEGSSLYTTAFSEYFTVDDGDLFVIDALTMAIDERPGDAPAGEARVQIEYPVIKITVETVDTSGAQVAGEVQLQDGVTTKGLVEAPTLVTMVDAPEKRLNVRTVIDGYDSGIIEGVVVTDRDLVTVLGSAPSTQENVEPVNTARISVIANAPPAVVAGPDQNLTCLAPNMWVRLDGSGTVDPDGDNLAYAWTAADTALAAGPTPDVLLPVRAEGHVITLTVTDARNAVGSDEVVITIVQDQSAPAVTIQGPGEGAWVRGTSTKVSGAITEELKLNKVAIDGRTVRWFVGPGPGYIFEGTARLDAEGPNLVVVEATDLGGKSSTAEITINRDRGLPALSSLDVAPTDGVSMSEMGGRTFFTAPEVTVSGEVSDPEPSSGIGFVKVGKDTIFQAAGAFSSDLVLGREGANNITLWAHDTVGNKVKQTIQAIRDTKVPSLSVSAPSKNALVEPDEVAVHGSARDYGSGIAAVTVNGDTAAMNGRSYHATVALAEGVTTLTVVATDSAGRSTERVVEVRRAAGGEPRVTLQVLNSGGGPLSGARVDLLKDRNGTFRGTGKKQHTGNDGKASFDIDPTGSYKLRVTYHGGTAESIVLPGPDGEGGQIWADTIQMALSRITFKDAGGTGIESARIDLMKETVKGAGVWGKTDANGVFEADVIPAFKHYFRVSWKGDTALTTLLTGGQTDAELSTVDTKLTFTSSSGAPIAGARIDLLKANDKGAGAWAKTGPDGKVSFEILSSLAHKFRIRYRGGNLLTAEASGAVDLAVSTRVTRFTLEDHADAGITGARVDLVNSQGKGVGAPKQITDGGVATFEVLTGFEHRFKVTLNGATHVTPALDQPALVIAAD